MLPYHLWWDCQYPNPCNLASHMGSEVVTYCLNIGPKASVSGYGMVSLVGRTTYLAIPDPVYLPNLIGLVWTKALFTAGDI